jgi:hypothetical protein
LISSGVFLQPLLLLLSAATSDVSPVSAALTSPAHKQISATSRNRASANTHMPDGVLLLLLVAAASPAAAIPA